MALAYVDMSSVIEAQVNTFRIKSHQLQTGQKTEFYDIETNFWEKISFVTSFDIPENVGRKKCKFLNVR